MLPAECTRIRYSVNSSFQGFQTYFGTNPASYSKDHGLTLGIKWPESETDSSLPPSYPN